ncbi:19306_t:CDS:2 [Gigaspora margarita]|uniref:19306_t:CDS:1 n=1 Tax=Gigaspora margarita TaxID=4874 RepID=A0ABM8W5J0_GIGMA|nr:19306_t:CDS:2 [Gigaspora margarita]
MLIKHRNDPTTWSTHELKEWLSEHRVIYRGIPEKKDLVCLVNNHKDKVTKTTKESVQDFVNYYIDSLQDADYEVRELSQEKYNEYSQSVASQIESLRQKTHLTEEQVNSVFDQISARLKNTKAATNENLSKALNQIKDSYAQAKERRDAITHDASSRIEKDLATGKEISQDTVDWFKEEINKLGESGAFAKARLGTQTSLILHVNTIYDKLSAAVEDSYRSINGTLERIRKELYDSVGAPAEYVVEEIRNQLSTVNDYRLLTQEKVQSILDNIGQKLQDGKSLTVEQLVYIKDVIKRGFGTVKFYYSSATGQLKQNAYDSKEISEEQLNQIIKGVQEKIQDLRKKGAQKLSPHQVESDISLHQLNPEQARILADVIKEKFGNLKNVQDLTEEKVSSFLTTLKVKLAETGEYLGGSYDTVKQNVYETKENKEEQLNQIIKSVQQKIQDLREKGAQKLYPHQVESDISLHQLNPEQARILANVVKENFGNLKNVQDLTEDKVSSFLTTLKVKLAETGEYLSESYDTAKDTVKDKVSSGYDSASENYDNVKDTVKDKVSSGYDTVHEGYQAAKNKAAEGYEKSSEKLNEGYQVAQNKASEGYEKASEKLGFDKMKEQLKHEKDEL